MLKRIPTVTGSRKTVACNRRKARSAMFTIFD